MGEGPSGAEGGVTPGPRARCVAVVIRLDADVKTLDRCLDAFLAQEGAGSIEWAVVGAHALEIQRQSSHQNGRWLAAPQGSTRGLMINIGVAAVEAEYVVLTSANTLPIGPDFLRRAIDTLAADSTAAAARCLQISNSGQAATWAQPKRIAYRDDAERKAAESRDGWAKDYPADDCCIIRRRAWEAIPFDEQAEAHEDKIWASQALSRGWSVISCAPVVWLQQKPPTPAERRRRIVREKRALYQITNKPSMSWSAFLRSSVSAILRAPIEAVRQTISTIAFNFRLASIPHQSRPADRRLAAALREESRE